MPGKRVKIAIMVAAVFGCASAAAAEVLILRATGPSAKNFRVGQRVPDNFTFRLQPGDSVTVLGRNGTRLFKGPGNYAAALPPKIEQLAAGENRPGMGALRGAEEMRRGRRAGTGASRGVRRGTGAVRGVEGAAPAPARPADVWLADVTYSGRVCVRAGEPLTLWRPNAARAGSVTVTAAGGTGRNFAWAAGQPTLRLPKDLPVTDGLTYEVALTGAQRPTRVTIASVPANLQYREAIASALLARSCRAQLEVFIATNVDPEDPGELEPVATGAAKQ